jgi:hypothetical protein
VRPPLVIDPEPLVRQVLHLRHPSRGAGLRRCAKSVARGRRGQGALGGWHRKGGARPPAGAANRHGRGPRGQARSGGGSVTLHPASCGSQGLCGAKGSPPS